MQEAIPPYSGVMYACTPLDFSKARSLSERASSLTNEVCDVASINTPTQVVLSGTTKAVKKAIELGQSEGLRRAIRLEVSAPFHSRLMEPAARHLSNILTEVQFSEFSGSLPLVSNVTGTQVVKTSELPALLVRQMTSPILWFDCVRHTIDQHSTRFLEIGPGNTLSSFVRQIQSHSKLPPSSLVTGSVGSLKDIQCFMRWLSSSPPSQTENPFKSPL